LPVLVNGVGEDVMVKEINKIITKWEKKLSKINDQFI
jgi:hypothetical protein